MNLLIGAFLLSLAWLVLWRLTTSAREVNKVTGKGLGHFLEIGIYKDQPLVMLGCLRDLCRTSLTLARILLPPSLLFVLPCLVVIPYLSLCFEERPIKVGESTVISVASSKDVRLSLPPGLELEVGPLRDPNRQLSFWRLRGEAPGVYEVEVSTAETTELKQIRVDQIGPVNARREQGWLHWVFHPVEKPLPDGAIAAIDVDYPTKTLWVGDMPVHWGWLLLLGFLLWTAFLSRIRWRRNPISG